MERVQDLAIAEHKADHLGFGFALLIHAKFLCGVGYPFCNLGANPGAVRGYPRNGRKTYARGFCHILESHALALQKLTPLPCKWRCSNQPRYLSEPSDSMFA